MHVKAERNNTLLCDIGCFIICLRIGHGSGSGRVTSEQIVKGQWY